MTKHQIKSILMDRCKCCLRERQSKDMWNEHFYDGDTENYGVMLSNCFQLPVCHVCTDNSTSSVTVALRKCTYFLFKCSLDIFLKWHEPMSGMEKICFLCIGRLQDAISFKAQIMEAQKFKSELLDDALRLPDVTDIEHKIEEFLEKHLNITVAFELNKQTPTIRSNSYFKRKPESEANMDQGSAPYSTDHYLYQESMCDESIATDTDISRAKNPLDISNDCEDNTNTEVEYLDEEYINIESGTEEIKARKKSIDMENNDIKVELVTQVNNDQGIVIVGNKIIKTNTTKNMVKVNKLISKPLNTRTVQDTESDTISAEPDSAQVVQYISEVPELLEQPDLCHLIIKDKNRTLSDPDEYEIRIHEVQHQSKAKNLSSQIRNAQSYLNELTSYTDQRENYLIERTKYQENVVALLITTNATPVQSKTDKGYECGFCQTYFYDLCDLKTHTHERHCNDEKATYMAETVLNNFVVRLDITDLHCIKCAASLKDLDAAWKHLIFHGIKVHMDIKNHIAAFKYEGDQLKCFVCEEGITFWGLIKHMNTHFKNVICDQCGEGFMYKRYLDYHVRYHEKGHYQCPHCPKQFAARVQYTSHKNQIHEKRERYVNRIVCAICQARFPSGKDKEKHLHLVHNVPLPKKKPVKCPRCDKMLSDKKALRRHNVIIHDKKVRGSLFEM